MLPLNEFGLPKVDSFLAITSEEMEKMFSDNLKAKYTLYTWPNFIVILPLHLALPSLG